MVIGYIFYYILKLLTLKLAGIIVLCAFALIGFIIGTFKVPELSNFKFTRTVGGENIDDIILRYIKFKNKKNRIYINTKEEKDDERK